MDRRDVESLVGDQELRNLFSLQLNLNQTTSQAKVEILKLYIFTNLQPGGTTKNSGVLRSGRINLVKSCLLKSFRGV